jgi:bidirectional [NiFe] hydrogenase diaphorase subunit
MIRMRLNDLEIQVEAGTSLLEAAQLYGFPIPTLCHMEGLSAYGACRLCVVEVGEGDRAELVSSCTYPVQEGLSVRTGSRRVVRARRMVLELLLASCPQSKIIQDLAAAHDVRRQRFRQEHDDCILCGLCVRMCAEQMTGHAIGFRGRGELRTIGTPYDVQATECKLCGGCAYVCPACSLRCTYTEPERAICGGCANLAAPCIDRPGFDDLMCYMDPCVACEIG